MQNCSQTKTEAIEEICNQNSDLKLKDLEKLEANHSARQTSENLSSQQITNYVTIAKGLVGLGKSVQFQKHCRIIFLLLVKSKLHSAYSDRTMIVYRSFST